MKQLCEIMACMLLLCGSCNKQGLPLKDKFDPDGLNMPRVPGIIIRRFETICINSFKGLQETVGTEIAVKSVTLDNGQVLESGKDALRMYFFAVNNQERNSIFLSHFVVEYQDGNNVVTTRQAVWSLGCNMTERGITPFTNIFHNNTAYLINTSFVWSVPPLASKGHKIVWLSF